MTIRRVFLINRRRVVCTVRSAQRKVVKGEADQLLVQINVNEPVVPTMKLLKASRDVTCNKVSAATSRYTTDISR